MYRGANMGEDKEELKGKRGEKTLLSRLYKYHKKENRVHIMSKMKGYYKIKRT